MIINQWDAVWLQTTWTVHTSWSMVKILQITTHIMMWGHFEQNFIYRKSLKPKCVLRFLSKVTSSKHFKLVYFSSTFTYFLLVPKLGGFTFYIQLPLKGKVKKILHFFSCLLIIYCLKNESENIKSCCDIKEEDWTISININIDKHYLKLNETNKVVLIIIMWIMTWWSENFLLNRDLHDWSLWRCLCYQWLTWSFTHLEIG